MMKNVINKNWRDAASLIVLSKRAGNVYSAGRGSKYDVLLQTRTEKGSFKRGVVFPGGVIASADGSPEWLQLLGSFGYSQSDFEALHRATAPVTPIFQNNPVQRQIALRITAIRETFEELGLLICTRTPKSVKGSIYSSIVSDFDVNYWQKQVSDDPSKLLNLCKELDCYPDLWSLHYWSNWLTPASMKKRFDTAFFVTALDARPVLTTNSEVEKAEWLSPTEILEKHSQFDTILYPPQGYELNRIARWSETEDIIRFASQHPNIGGKLIYHTTVKCPDGYFFTLPGDDLYPEEIDLNSHHLITSEKTIIEHRESCKVAHRFEFHSNSDKFLVFKNYKPDNVDMGDEVIKIYVTHGI